MRRSLLPLLPICLLFGCDDTGTPTETETGTEQKVERTAGSVSIDPAVDTLRAIGDTAELAATVIDAGGDTIEAPTLDWTSLDPAVAEVDEDGRAVSVATGTAEIVATSEEVADTTTLVSVQVTASVTVMNDGSGASTDSLEWGWEGSYSATASDSNQVEIPGASFTWSSSDPAYVMVSGTGEVDVVFGFEETVAVTATTDQGVEGSATIVTLPGDLVVAVDDAEPSVIPEDASTEIQISAEDPVPPGMEQFSDGASVHIVDDGGEPQLEVEDVEFIDETLLGMFVRAHPGDAGLYDVVVVRPEGTWGQIEDGLEVVVTASVGANSNLVVTEFMADPSVSDAHGEWFEVHNADTTALDLNGLMVVDDGGETFTVSEPLFVPEGGHVVFGANSDGTLNGGVPVDHVFGDSFTLVDDGDVIELTAESEVLDRVDYTDPTVTEGVALSLSSDAYDATSNDEPENWCDATEAYNADGDKGTPGATNPPCP